MSFNIDSTYKKTQLNNKADDLFLKGFLKANFLNKFEIISKYNSGQNCHTKNINNEHFERISNDSWYDTSVLKKKKDIYLLCREIKNNNSEDSYKKNEISKSKLDSTKLNDSNIPKNILKPINDIASNENDKKNMYDLPYGSHSSYKHTPSVKIKDKKLHKITKINNLKKEYIKNSSFKFSNYKIFENKELETSSCNSNLNKLKSNFTGFKNKIKKKKELKNNFSKYKRSNSSKNYRDYNLCNKNVKNFLEKDDLNSLKMKMFDQNIHHKNDNYLMNNLKKYTYTNINESDILKENKNDDTNEKILLAQIKKEEYFSSSNTNNILENENKKSSEQGINFMNEIDEKISHTDEELSKIYKPFNQETKKKDVKKNIYNLEEQNILCNKIHKEKKIIENEKKIDSLSKNYILSKYRLNNEEIKKSLGNLFGKINSKEKKELLLESSLTNLGLSDGKILENLSRDNSKYIKSNFEVSNKVSEDNDVKLSYLSAQKVYYKTSINTEIFFTVDFKIYKPILMKNVTQLCVYMDNKLLKNIYINEFPQSFSLVLQPRIKINNEKIFVKVKNKIINIKESNVLKFIFLNNEKEIGYSHVSIKNLLCLGPEGGVFVLVEDYEKRIKEENKFMLSQIIPFNKQEINILKPKIFLNYKIKCPKFLIDSIPLCDIVTTRDKIRYLEDMIREIYNFIQNSPLMNSVKNGKLLNVINEKNLMHKNIENTNISNNKNLNFICNKLKCNEKCNIEKNQEEKNSYEFYKNKNNLLYDDQRNQPNKLKKYRIYYKKDENNKCKMDKITYINISQKNKNSLPRINQNNTNTNFTVDYKNQESNYNASCHLNNNENNIMNYGESSKENNCENYKGRNNNNNSINYNEDNSNKDNISNNNMNCTTTNLINNNIYDIRNSILEKNMNNTKIECLNKNFDKFVSLDKSYNYPLYFGENKIYSNIEDSKRESKNLNENIKGDTNLTEILLVNSKLNCEYDNISEEKTTSKKFLRKNVINSNLNLNSEKSDLTNDKTDVYGDLINNEKLTENKKNNDLPNKLKNKNDLDCFLENMDTSIIDNEKNLKKKTSYEEIRNVTDNEENEEPSGTVAKKKKKKKMDDIYHQNEINETNKINQKCDFDIEKDNNYNLHLEYSDNESVEIRNINLGRKISEISSGNSVFKLDKISDSCKNNNLKNMNNPIKTKKKEIYVKKKSHSTKRSDHSKEIYNESKKKIEDLNNIIEENKRELELRKIEIEKLKHSNNNINILYGVCYRRLLEIEKNKNVTEGDFLFKFNEIDNCKLKDTLISNGSFKKSKYPTLYKSNSFKDIENTSKILKKNKMKNNYIALSKSPRKNSVIKFVEDQQNNLNMNEQKNEKGKLYLDLIDELIMNTKFDDKEKNQKIRNNLKKYINLTDKKKAPKNDMETNNHENKKKELKILLKENKILKRKINKLKLSDEEYLNIIPSFKEETLLNNMEHKKINTTSQNKNVEKNYIILFLDKKHKKKSPIDIEKKNRYYNSTRFNLPIDLINNYLCDTTSDKTDFAGKDMNHEEIITK
ncbi:conserved Plasmodium protein, unknown function [Plasmodium gallinaceum]|uniref:Uncharacterized protein n=1 Tax=Plasmodium gallinaceum TaxID=5849 RepID=A0A1J1GS91_PLAGA|nr:conserved Plasmodium protein, unknown function [Plasmodium gallinaceum]CRG93915.1 conserved Plasmodium protein, unknown function [Plasmodium gallinaceum]